MREQYGTHERQRFWVDNESKPGGTWLIVIHGGLWIDNKITDLSGTKLAQDMKRHFTGVASIDYRLSPEISHPLHMNDCAEAIKSVQKRFTPEKLVFIGHSAGAYLAGQLVPEFSPTTVIGLEGIYDLEDLILEYPSLENSISLAFGDRSQWPASRPQWTKFPVQIIQSNQDELLTPRQSQLAFKLNPESTLTMIDNGTHDYVFEKSDLEPVLKNLLN